MRRTRLAAVAVCAALLATSACGGETEGKEAGSDGDVDLKVGVIPIVDTAPIWLGDDKGFFEDEGIDLSIETTSGGAAAVPGVVSGDFDFAFGNVVSLMVAAEQGLDLQFVVNGVSTTGEAKKDFSAVVVPEDSPIKTPADLDGAKVSVNNLKNIGDTTVRYAIEQDGGDSSGVDFVEVPFPDAPAALSKGEVDAAWVLDPFLTTALGNGARVVSWNYVEMSPKLDIAGYFATDEFLETNPDLSDRFTSAMTKSMEYADAHPDEVRDIVGTYTEIDEKTRQKMTLPTYRAEFDRASMETLGEAAVDFGTLSDAPDLDSLLP
ncbi:MAG TPA: ABC transporter substrate-binding protein [Nocardioidaceae bacterium]|nr:ABC transporter substrate-binding protein [Nocardioidaceae bacterium]